jgi:fructosamine-3-kinase
MSTDAAAAVSELLGVPVDRVLPLGGAASEVHLANGDRVVAKSHGLPGAALAEAASLEWLGEPGFVAVPGLRASNESWLVTDLVASGSSNPQAAEELGRGLARLHTSGAPAFGSPPAGGPADASIGLAPMRNIECDSWSEFYGRYRIEPYLRTAVDRGTIGSGQAKLFHDVIARLDDLGGPPEPPARLHGDLWSGNVLWGADGRAWLIDPAAHGGHRETDLAMLQLFGCPHLETILDAYNEEAPLAEGWRKRVPLHQLFPLLVHTVLFGGSYAAQAAGAARAALTA